MINPIIMLNPIFSDMVKPGNPFDRDSERSGRAQRDCNRLIRVACRYTLDWIEGDKKALVEKFRYVKGTRASFPRASQRVAATCQADSHR